MGRTTTLEPPARPVPPIDPRIRARRIEVRRGQGRRRLQRLVDVGVLATVALGFLGALWSPLLDVDEVRVEGGARSGQAAVLEQAGIEVGDRLVGLDLHAAGERIADLPWVHEVQLARGIAGVVTVRVQERVPVATVAAGAEALLVDPEGRVLGAASSAPDVTGLVAIEGVEAPAPGAYLGARSAGALALAAAVAEAVPGAVAAIRSDGLTATLVQGGEVRFGDATQLDAKVRSLATMLDQVDLTCLAVLDLRLPSNAVLTREEGCS
jgi:cell division protein FtsQ